MPFMAGLNGEEGPHVHGNPAHGVERYMELKGTWFHIDGGFRSLQALNLGVHGFRCWDV
jgi:hypothetical protein